MSRWLTARALVVAAAVIVMAGGVGSAAPSARVGADQWTQLADQTYTEAVVAEGQAEAGGQYVRAQFLAALAWYAGLRFGWHDQRTQGWLGKLFAERTPTGGYGLGTPFDAYGDGSTNSSATAYTITGAWHVGRLLLAGYDGGGVPAQRVQEVADWMMRVPLAGGGHCSAYSENANDAGKPCVWNVSATAAWFLWQGYRRGLFPAGQQDAVLAKIRSWRNDVRAHYNATLGGWTYQANTTALQDVWHNAATVAPMFEADPSIGVPALAAHFRNWPASGANADLLPDDCTKADANFAAIEASATQPADTPAEVLQTRSGYAPALLLVAATCAG